MLDGLQLFALGLLLLRLIALGFLISVLRKQINYFISTYTEAPRIRRALFTIVVVMTVGQIVPILIDIAALAEVYARNPIHPLGYAYAFSNAITAAVSAFGWSYLYKIFEADYVKLTQQGKDNTALSNENTRLENNETKRKEDHEKSRSMEK